MWLDFLLLLTAYLCNIINGAKLNLNDYNYDKYKGSESNDEIPNENLKNLNRVLVKRIVPRGYESKALEYDKKFKTYYRPIARFHKGKLVHMPIVSDHEVTDDEVSKADELNEYLESHYDSLTKRTDEENNLKKLKNAIDILLSLRKLHDAPIERSSGENSIVKKLYDKYKDVVFSLLDKQFGGDSKKKKEFLEEAINRIKKLKDKKDLLFTLSKALTSLMLLRTRDDDLKQEVDIKDSIFLNDTEINQTEKPRVQLPYVPYWNYWTYEKTMHVDNCKHGWIRYHDMCIEVPPH